MEGLLSAHKRMEEGNVPVVVHAAAIAYGFVFLHPFEDGNGRIHRFLIHNIFARQGLTPQGLMFPISASMAKQPGQYNDSLEAFSRKLMPMVDYDIDEHGEMAVKNDTGYWYRYIDMTAQAEALFLFVQETIGTVLIEELQFLQSYDRTKKALQNIVDMPDRKIDLFMRFCLQNNRKLSSRKRAKHFQLLSDAEVSEMEDAIRAGYSSTRIQ